MMIRFNPIFQLENLIGPIPFFLGSSFLIDVRSDFNNIDSECKTRLLKKSGLTNSINISRNRKKYNYIYYAINMYKNV